MRKSLLPLFFVMTSLFVGCDSDRPDDVVNAVADVNADFCSYHTFKFYTIDEADGSQTEIPLPPNAANAELLFKNEVTTQLNLVDVTETETDPDLRVNFLWALNEASLISTECGSYWYGYWFGYACIEYEEEVPVGTVIMDLVDSATNQTVFRGIMQGIIDNSGESEERIAEAVAKVFAEYPTNITPCP